MVPQRASSTQERFHSTEGLFKVEKGSSRNQNVFSVALLCKLPFGALICNTIQCNNSFDLPYVLFTVLEPSRCNESERGN